MESGNIVRGRIHRWNSIHRRTFNSTEPRTRRQKNTEEPVISKNPILSDTNTLSHAINKDKGTADPD